jgi:WD40 repeat protein
MSAHDSAVHALVWLDENNVVSGCEQGWLVCHDLRSPQYSWKVQVASAAHQGIFSVAKVQEAFDLYVGLSNGGLCSYNIQVRRFSMAPTKIHEGDVRCVVAWEDAETDVCRSVNVLTTSYDGSAAVWNTSGSVVAKSSRSEMPSTILVKKASLLNGHTDKVLSAARCPHTGIIVTTGADGRAVLWK